MTAYAELQVTSNYSFLRGASHIEELFAQASMFGLSALGITDRNSLAGIVRAHQRAEETNVRCVIGTRLDLTDGASVLIYPTAQPAYARLCRLLTLGKSRAGKAGCDLTWNDLAAAAEGKTIAVRILPHDALAAHFQSPAKSSASEPSLINRLKSLQLIGEVFGAEIARHMSAAGGSSSFASKRFERLIGGLTEPEILDFTPAALARRCGCSLRHFGRLFHAHFGTSMRSRQTELRLQKASLLLLDTNHKVIDVAMDSGYRHLGLFNNLFKKHLGMTPSQWRKKKNAPARPPPRPAGFVFLRSCVALVFNGRRLGGGARHQCRSGLQGLQL